MTIVLMRGRFDTEKTQRILTQRNDSEAEKPRNVGSHQNLERGGKQNFL